MYRPPLSRLLFITLKPRVRDTKVYAPQIRALLGTASHFCEVVVLKLRTLPIGTALSLRTLRLIRRGAQAMYKLENEWRAYRLLISSCNVPRPLRPWPEYSRANSYPWSPFPPRRARPGPGLYPTAAAEREGKILKAFKDFCLNMAQAKARIWP